MQPLTPEAERLSGALADRYRVERALGAGGMATVYLAEDLKHDRKVAIKVLKPELAAVLGGDRFVVEIKTTAALQHPHILPLFDSGEADGLLYYVMPYIQGETIREKLTRETQFGVDESVRIAREVADALDYAHRHGVIHRDIKPENILLHDGRAMVMDFGIALAVSAAAGGRMTETGLSLGTPHYMSPEQATAEKEISARSDVYSLASVLYEMLAGQPPHVGGAAQQVIMKILTEQPARVDTLRKSAPPHVAAALAKALEKLPADRFESAKAFSDALANATFTTSAGRRARVSAAASGSWRERLAIPAVALAAALTLTTLWALTRKPPTPPIARYQVELPAGMGVGSTNWSPLAVSPDGSKLVYSGETGRLFLRTRDRLEVVELAGTDGAFNPFFSHDGLRVGFMAGAPGNAEIKVAVLSGGPPTTVLPGGGGGPGAAFGYDGFVYYDAPGIGPLKRIRESGGTPEDASVRDSAGGELQHNWPEPLANGRGLLMVIDRAGPGVNIATTNDVAVLDLKTRKHKVLMRGVYAKYAASGHILYVTANGVLMAVPFDQDRMELTGSAVALREGITVRRGGGGVDLTLSESGTLWYGAGSASNRREVVWASRTGESSDVASGWTGDFEGVALSPDGTRLAISIIDGTGQQIWVRNVATTNGALSKLTFDGVNSIPRWHPDGKQVLFIAAFLPKRNIRTVRADGSSPAPTTPAQGDTRTYSASWSRDGRWMAVERRVENKAPDIYAVRTDGDTTLVPLSTTAFAERNPVISPDGKWVLYDASTTGTTDVYVRPFPNAAAALYQVSTGGGRNAAWSRDGREIFFTNGNNELARVAVVPGNSFSVADQRVLFSLRGVTNWDVAPDGERFVMIRDRAGKERTKLIVVENFFEELKARVPR
jgi:serine/threonine-protein kinase